MFASKPYDIACNILPFAARLLPLPWLKRAVRIHTAGLGSSPLPSFLHPSEHQAPAKCYRWRQHYAEGKIRILHSAQLSRAKWLIKSPGHQLKRGKGKGWCCGWNWEGREADAVGCGGGRVSPWAGANASHATRLEQRYLQSACLFLQSVRLPSRAFCMSWDESYLKSFYKQRNLGKYLTRINTLQAAQNY